MGKSKFGNSIALTALACGLMWSGAALAQDAANAPADPNAPAAANQGGVDEIVVTAQFRAQNLQQTPLAITAVSSAMLEARSQTNISQIASQAPSVTLKPQGAAFGPSLGASIRGVGQFDFNPGFEPGVGVYIDDVYFATLTGSIFDLLDLDRIEVLRGPQGTLAGKNSIGGAIKLYSKKPTGDTGGYISATYGSRQRVDLRGSADIKLTDGLFARVSGVAKRQRGYIDRLDYGCVNPNGGIPATRSPAEGCVVGHQGEVNYQAVRTQLRYEASDRFEVNLAADYTHDERRTAGSVLTVANYTGAGFINPYGGNIPYDSRFICGRYCNYSTFNSPAQAGNLGPLSPNGYAASYSDDRVRLDAYGFSGTADWKLTEDISLKSITAYRNYDTFFGNDDDFSPLAHSLGRSYVKFHSFSQELRLNGALGQHKEIEYTIGGFYQTQKSNYTTFQDLRYAAPGFPPFVGIDRIPAKTKAVFGHLSWHPTEALTVIGGIRYTDESKSNTYLRNSPNGTPHPLLGALNNVVGRYSGSNVDYRGTVQYQFTPTVMAYAQYSTGFKGGGVSPRPFAAEQVISFGPEKLKSWEAGLKTDLFDRHLRFNLAGFYSRYDQIQLTVLSCPDISPRLPAPCPITRNVGNASIKGFEMEANLRPTDRFLIDASMSYVDLQYRRSSEAALRAIGIALTATTPYNPKWKWSAGAQYEIPIDGIGSITPRIDAAYQSSIFTTATNSPASRIAGYTVASARVTYRNEQGDWEISAELTNMFKKYYFLTSFDLTGAGAGIASAQPGRPREWGITVKKKF